MLDHIVIGLEDAVTIAHQGGFAQLTIERDTVAHGAPIRWRLVTLRGKPFTAVAKRRTEHDLGIRITHHDAQLLARVRYYLTRAGQERLLVSLDGDSSWRLAWRHLAKTIRVGHVTGQPLEPKGPSDARTDREARDPARLPGGPAAD